MSGEHNLEPRGQEIMKTKTDENRKSEPSGKIGWAILWLIGVPLPILIILYVLTGGGCNG
jgi:hypothetical protein